MTTTPTNLRFGNGDRVCFGGQTYVIFATYLAPREEDSVHFCMILGDAGKVTGLSAFLDNDPEAAPKDVSPMWFFFDEGVRVIVPLKDFLEERPELKPDLDRLMAPLRTKGLLP